MNYKLSTEELKEKFGDVFLEIISQKENTRISCVRRLSDNAVIAYSIVTFYHEGILAFGDTFHNQIISGQTIGETIKNLAVPHERLVSDIFSAKINFSLAFLFNTQKDICVSRIVNYKIKDLPYACITEFYNPEFTSAENLQDNLKENKISKECFVIDELKAGFEENYLKLAHGFLKQAIHLGIEDQDTFVKETSQTLDLLMKDTNTKLFVVANDTQFIAYVALNTHPALNVNGLECVVRELYIKDEYQRKGIGTSLMIYVENYAKKRDCKRIALATKWDDEKRKGFYESIGFSRRCDFIIKKL